MSVTTKQKTLRIIIVDDNADQASALSMLLEHSGYDSHVCNNSQDCLGLVDSLRPDVVLLDLEMPVMTGYEIAEVIKSEEDLQDILLFAVTGHGLPLDRLQTKVSGFDAHLLKPIDFENLDSLLKAVKNALD